MKNFTSFLFLSISILLNAIVFDDPVSVLIPRIDTNTEIKVADFNNDGFEDVLTIGYNGSYESVQIFSPQDANFNIFNVFEILPSGPNYRKIEIVDLDLDGFKDIVVLTTTDAIILKNNNNFEFTQWNYNIANYATIIHVENLNNDEYPDLVLRKYDRVEWLINDGNIANMELFSSLLSNHCIEICDYNNDGNKDLLYSNSGTYFHNNFFEDQTSTPVLLLDENLLNFVAQDYDQDGDFDIFSLSQNLTLFQNSENTFEQEVIATNDLIIESKDIDNDGFTEFFYKREVVIEDEYSRVYYYCLDYNEEDFVESEIFSLSVNYSINEICFHKFGSDDEIDCVYSYLYTADNSTSTTIRLNTNGDVSNETFYPGINFSCTHFFDYDNDGVDEILHSNSEKNYIAFRERDENGNITNNDHIIYQYPDGYSDLPKKIKIIDFDNDSDLDLVIVTNTNIILLDNLGDNNFSDAIELYDDAEYYAYSFQDYNNDGLIDLLHLYTNSNRYCLLNNGDNSFTYLSFQDELGGTYTHTAMWDIDHDGDLDFFYVIPGENTVMLQYNEVTFFGAPIILYTSPETVYDLMLKDLDNDGNYDLVIRNNDLVVLQNDLENSNSFIPHYTGEYIEWFMYGEIFMDIDNDGDMDLFCQESTLWYTLGAMYFENIDGVFSQRNIFMGYSLDDDFPVSFIIYTDFNNDGLIDIFYKTGDGADCKVMYNTGIDLKSVRNLGYSLENNEINLSWNEPENLGDNFIHYKIKEIYSNTVTTTSDTFFNGGLAQNRKYHYQVFAVYSEGDSYSRYTIFRPQITYPVINLEAQVEGNNVTLTWDDTPQALDTVSSYPIAVNGETEFGSTTLQTKTYENLPNGTYVFDVTARYSIGDSEPTSITIDIEIDYPVTNFVAVRDSNDVQLSWDISDLAKDRTRTIVDFAICRNGEVIDVISASETQYEDIDVVNGTHLYSIFAIYEQNNSVSVYARTIDLNIPYAVTSFCGNLTDESIHFEWEINELSGENVEHFLLLKNNEQLVTLAPNLREYQVNEISVGSNNYKILVCYQDSLVSEDSEIVNVELTNSDINNIVKFTDISKIYPNPFYINNSTRNQFINLKYQIKEDTNVKIDVFNIKGQHIRTIENSFHKKGKYSVVWSGKNAHQNTVSSGVYFMKLKTDKTEKIKKFMIVK